MRTSWSQSENSADLMLIFDTEPIACSHLIGHMSPLLTKRYVDLEITPTTTHLRVPRKFPIRAIRTSCLMALEAWILLRWFSMTVGLRFPKTTSRDRRKPNCDWKPIGSDLLWLTAFPITPREDTEIGPRRIREHRYKFQ